MSPLRWICALLLCCAACKDKPKEPEAVAQKAPPADPAPQLPTAGDLGQQLAVEAASRKPDALKAEVVLEALGKAQIPVGATKQFMGRTVLANYCFGGITGRGTSVTLCEYSGVDAAKAGLAHSQTQFASIPRRTLIQNKATVLTLVRADDGLEAKKEADQAIEVFTKL